MSANLTHPMSCPSGQEANFVRIVALYKRLRAGEVARQFAQLSSEPDVLNALWPLSLHSYLTNGRTNHCKIANAVHRLNFGGVVAWEDASL